jgi:hypothetical protein
MDGYYFYFTDGNGNQFEVFGTGGASSGSITTLTKACYFGTVYTTASSISGTFSLSGGTAYLSNVNISEPGGWIFAGYTYAEYHTIFQGSFTFTCSGGGE